ncbi:MAG: DnaD domain protein [Clostridiales bacterium]|nr:DnaD domain protein [Clostridiales bacterium]
MALCTFSNNYHMFDITPVENLFIQEFMLKAPGDFVKIYLYGLKQCYCRDSSENSIESFARALDLEQDVVKNAFRYWERQGILKTSEDEHGNFSVEYYNIKDILYSRDISNEKVLYKYRDFNQNLQLIFDKRLLTPQEYLRIYDWLEVLQLPKEVVLMMIRFYLSKKGPKLSINYLDKVAEQWAKDGIDTLQKAEEYIESCESYYQDTIAVLKYLGIHRPPTKAELELYRKWHNQWDFSLNAILQACKETTKTSSPNLGYLDKILENLHNLNIKTSQQIQEYLKNREKMSGNIKAVLFELGYRDTTPTPEHQAFYYKWSNEWKLEHDVIILACKHCVRKNLNTSFESLDTLLKQWIDNGLRTKDDIKDYLKKKQKLNAEIQAVLDKAGEQRPITAAVRKLYNRWTKEWEMSYELVLLAAEYSVAAKNKLSFMNKILYNWRNGNIKTADEARAEHERHLKGLYVVGENKPLKKQVDFSKFEQHSYTDEELEFLFEDIENG